MVGALVARCQVASASCGECTEVQARTAATWRVLVPAAGVVRRPPAHFPGRQRRGELDSRRRRGVSRWQVLAMKPVESGRERARGTNSIKSPASPSLDSRYCSGKRSRLLRPPALHSATAEDSYHVITRPVMHSKFRSSLLLVSPVREGGDAVRECASLFSSQFRSPN